MKVGLAILGLWALAAPGCTALRERTEERKKSANGEALSGPPLVRAFDKEYQSMKDRTSGMGMPPAPVTIDELMKQSNGPKGP